MGRRSLLIGCATGTLEGIDNDLNSMAVMLDRYGFDCLDRVDGSGATRAVILQRLDAFIAETRPGDAALIYYSGHGGCLPWLPGYSKNYPHQTLTPGLCATRPRHYQFLVPVDFTQSSANDFRGIADIELAHKLALLTDKTPNVIVILDCCFAQGVVRSAGEGLITSRSASRGLGQKEVRWLRGLAGLGDELERRMEGRPRLHPEANPHAVILSAALPEQQASERAIGQGPVHGIMTHALVTALDECRGRHVSWRALHHRVCAEVLAATGGSQCPQLSGPGDRVLFGLEPAPAVAAIYIMYEGAQPYLSAGELAGVDAGDRFAILPTTAEQSDDAVAVATVVAVMPERAFVRLEAVTGSMAAAAVAQVPAGSWAHPLHSRGRFYRVAIRAGDELVTRVRASLKTCGVLELCTEDEAAAALPRYLATLVECENGKLQPIDEDGRPLDHAMAPGECLVASMRRLRRAAIARSLRSGAGQHALGVEVGVEWGLVANGIAECIAALKPVKDSWDAVVSFQGAEPAVVTSGARIYLKLSNHDVSQSTYWSVLSVDVDGEVELCTQSAPAGIKIPGGESSTIGARPQDRFTGLAIEWPRHAPAELPGLRSFVIVAMSQPHDLRALTRARLEAYGVAPSVDELTGSPAEAVTRSGSRPPAAPLRYAVFRLDIRVTR